MFEKTEKFHKFCTMTIFIRLLYLVTFTADMGLLTTIDYYDHTRDHTEMQLFNPFKSDNLQLQITIRSCQQQTNGADRRIYAVASAFFISSGIDESYIKIDK